MGYRVLGAIELVDGDGHTSPITSANQRTLLAVLLAARGQTVSVDALVEALWPEAAPPTALSTLRTYVSRLRSQVGPALTNRAGGYALDLPAGELDADHFETLADAAFRAGDADAADLLASALRLWKGPAYGDCADVERVRAEARRLEARRAAAREAHAAALLGAGRIDEAVAAAEALVSAEPLREGGWAVLIEALAGASRTADALRAFRRAAAALAEAGLEPTARLRRAEQEALSDQGAAGPTAERRPAQAPRYLPPFVLSSLVGRDEDARLVADLASDTRLVTLTGPGGVGKTRLALEAGRRAAERTGLGACLVELAAVASPGAVADTIVAALGLTGDGRPAVELLPSIGHLDLLLLLDNAEHVIDEAAAAVERILSGGPSARVLATSREPLALAGEHVWTVAPLATAGAEAAAAALFRERAATVGAAVDEASVARIVQRLDGLPLAIEMAAAQLDTMTAPELATALETGVQSLRSVHRSAPDRHRSLQDVLAWSEARLDDAEASAFAALSVFAGPVTGPDIEAVLAQPGVLDVVRALARRSLVSVDRTGSPARFSLLHTIRTFARQRLDATDRVDTLLRRHAEWFTDVARAADAQLRTADEASAQRRVESVLAELRAAYGWAADHDVDLAAELCAHLYVYAQARFVDEPLAWADALVDRVAPDHAQRPVLLASAATRLIRRGLIDDARRLAAEAAQRAGDRAAALPALDALVDAGLFDGRLDESGAAARAMVEVAHRHGDTHFVAVGTVGVALADAYGGRPDAAADTALEELERGSLSPSASGWVAYARGELCQLDDPRRALVHFDEARRRARLVGNRYLEGAATVSSCSLSARTGDPDEALAVFADVLDHWSRVANLPGLLTALRNLATLFQRLDMPEAVAELAGTVDRDKPTYGDEADRLDAARAWARAALGDERFDELTTLGASRHLTAATNAALHAISARQRSAPQPARALRADVSG